MEPIFDKTLLLQLFASPKADCSSSVESTDKLLELLKDDLMMWHLYWNHQGYHNHLAHHLYALYSLRASPDALQQAFKRHSTLQRKSFLSPNPICLENWTEHLGDERYYNAYLKFFANQVADNGIETVLTQFIFRPEVNAPKQGARSLNMLSRLFGGLMHSLLQLGHGAEFGVLGTSVQGLAWAAVHNDELAALFNNDFFQPPAAGPKSRAFAVIAQMLQDLDLSARPGAVDLLDETGIHLSTFLSLKTAAVLKHTRNWRAGVSSVEQLDDRVRELAYLGVLLYGVSGEGSKDGGFRPDFFFMHFVTSSRFLAPIARLLDVQSQNMFLEAWFTFVMAYWVKRGRPTLPIKTFFESSQRTLCFVEHAEEQNKNAVSWSSIVPKLLSHRDEHFLKILLTLSHYAKTYGDDRTGLYGEPELAAGALVDGSLFGKVAYTTARHFGVLDTSSPGTWARKCFL